MVNYTLYELISQEGASPQFSSHVTKTQLALAYLGVPYTARGLTFAQIRDELVKKTGNQEVTVPTLASDEGLVITDSWKIAEYLEEKYAKPAGKTLFGDDRSKALCKFVERYLDYTVWSEMSLMLGPRIWTTLEGASKEYFVTEMWSRTGPKMQENLDSLKDPNYVKEMVRKTVRNLFPLEAMLQEQKDQGKGPWINGEAITHADFCVFGWYSFSRLNPDLISMVWENERLPRIQALIRAVLDLGLISEQDLPVGIKA